MERETHFIGESPAFLDALERASRAAALNRPVLVIGERGTGKELIAERLHRLSPRWGEAMIVLNCAALPETLIEAELFGHEAGAFTGAMRARAGRFEEADGGTLFLDELATLSAAAQERLLRAIEYGEVTRIGASRPLRVDVRIVAATNEHLPRLVEQGRFRADLLDRLSFEVVTLPPLRHRQSDILVLAEFFGRRMALDIEMDTWPGFSTEASPSTYRRRSSSLKTWNSPESMAESKTSGSSFRARASMTKNVAVSPRSVAFCLAKLIGSARKSMPVTLWPRLAKKRAFSPVPHPESRIDPVIRSATARSAFCGMPISHRG